MPSQADTFNTTTPTGDSALRAESKELPQEVRAGVYIVVPAFNESRSIASVVGDLRASYPNVIVVDDGSKDETFAVAKSAGAVVLRHSINRGQGAALQTGIEFALSRGAHYVVTFDADGQHQVADVSSIVEPLWRKECQVTLGSRFLGDAVNLPASRRLLLRMGVFFTRLVNGTRLTDTHNGLRGFSREAARHVDIHLDGMAHASEMIDIISRNRLSFREVPVQIHYTDYSIAKGQSSRGAIRIVIQYLLDRVLR